MKIDNELTDLIKKTLSEHEESYVEGAWENFVYQQRRKRKVLYWRITSSVAACLLLGLLFISIPGNDPALQKITTATQQITSENNPQPKESKQNAVVHDNSGNVSLSENIGEVEKVVNIDKSKYLVETKKKAPQTVLKKEGRELIAENMPDNMPDNMTTQSPALTDKEKESAAIQKNEPSEKAVAIQEKEKQGYTFDIRESDDVRGKNLKKKKVLLGFNLSPGINSTSTGTSFNYAGGVNLEIALLPKLSLSTGIQIEHQTVETVNSVSNAAIPSDHINANLTNLDIPINITWRFLTKGAGKEKYSYYVSGGVSSLAYLGERYVMTTYKQEVREQVNMVASEAKITYQLENFETTSENKAEPFNAFNVAGRINLIFGIERKISQDLNLHIEPYVKIPISGLGTENMKFMTSGITCKISF
ncbi:MAG: PorT family protein [Bacteroidales bacterium]|nr:PorT family protein [Bacteroidales bacterium]